MTRQAPPLGAPAAPPSWARTVRAFAVTVIVLGLLGAAVALWDARSTGLPVATTMTNALLPVVGAAAAAAWAWHLLRRARQGAQPSPNTLTIVLLGVGGLMVFSSLAQVLLEGGSDFVLERSDDGATLSLAQPLWWLVAATFLAFGLALRRTSKL